MNTTIRRFSAGIGVIAALAIAVGYVLASDGYTAAQTTPVSVTGPDGVCKKITNGSETGLSEYIPTATVSEWQSFVANPPAGVSLGSCGFAWTKVTPLGYAGWMSVASSADGRKLFAKGLWALPLVGSDDYGATWKVLETYTSMHNLDLASSDDGTKLVAGDNGGDGGGGSLYTSTDSGVTWTSRTPAKYWWYSVASSADGTRLAAVNQYGIYKATYIYTSADSGVTWVARSAAGKRKWYGIASSADGTKLAATANSGYIYTSTDGGATWTARTSAGSRPWFRIASSADGTRLTAAVVGGSIYTSADGGATWTERTGAGQRSWSALASSADGMKIAAGEGSPLGGGGGYLYTSSDGGATWTAQTAAGQHNWMDIASSADGTRLIAAAYDIVNSTIAGDIWIGVQ